MRNRHGTLERTTGFVSWGDMVSCTRCVPALTLLQHLFPQCAISAAMALPRERRNAPPAFFVATDAPEDFLPLATEWLGERVRTQPQDSPYEARKNLEHGIPSGSDALVDLWLLGECDDVVLTPGSSFGWVAAARTGRTPLTLTKWGKCVRPISPSPPAHGWLLIKDVSCFSSEMLRPEFDMLCPSCTRHECNCGTLSCASHSELTPTFHPRPVGSVAG